MSTFNLSLCCCILKCEQTNNPVPLKSLDVNVNVVGIVSNVMITMTFENVEEKPIEAIYEFPLDDESIVYKFQCEIQDRLIVAECQEKKQAKQTYNEAISQGHMATYAEQDDTAADIFRCKVGNLMPKAIAKVIMSYACELALQTDGTLRYTLPTILNARYNPTVESGGAVKPPLPFLGVTVGQPTPYVFAFKALVKSDGKMVQVTSLRDKYNVSYDAKLDVTIAELINLGVTDHDISFDLACEKPFEPKAFIETGISGNTGASLLSNDLIMLNFVPKFDDGDRSSMHEMIFVLDRSGSMQGSQMAQARETLMLMVKSLPQASRFNIIGFGSSFESLFEGDELSQVYSAESLGIASKHAEVVEADLGGTEILQPLQHVYSKPLLPSHARQIILITDGEVYNTHAIIDLVRENAHHTRLFAIGIGDGVSTSLVKGVARAGKGLAEFVKPSEKMQPIVMKVMKAAMQPTVTDVKLEFNIPGISDIKMVPEHLGPVFGEDRLLAFGFLPTGVHQSSPGLAYLSGKVGTRLFKYPVNIPVALQADDKDDSKVLHRLAICKEVKHLEDSEKKDTEEHKDSIVALSLAANVISKYTAMVGVDKKKNEIISADLKQRSVPLQQNHHRMMACSYGGPGLMRQSVPMRSPMMACAYKCSGPMIQYDSVPEQVMCSAYGGGGGGEDAYEFQDVCQDNYDSQDGSHEECQDLVPTVVVATYMDIVKLQSFDGSWSLTEDLCKHIGVTMATLKQDNHATAHGEQVWATVAAVVALRRRYPKEKEEWELVERKGIDWLLMQITQAVLTQLVEAANKIIHCLSFLKAK